MSFALQSLASSQRTVIFLESTHYFARASRSICLSPEQTGCQNCRNRPQPSGSNASTILIEISTDKAACSCTITCNISRPSEPRNALDRVDLAVEAVGEKAALVRTAGHDGDDLGEVADVRQRKVGGNGAEQSDAVGVHQRGIVAPPQGSAQGADGIADLSDRFALGGDVVDESGQLVTIVARVVRLDAEKTGGGLR